MILKKGLLTELVKKKKKQKDSQKSNNFLSRGRQEHSKPTFFKVGLEDRKSVNVVKLGFHCSRVIFCKI